MAVVRSFEVMLGQMLNHYVELFNYMKCDIFVNDRTFTVK
jgi:hypothetical protein